MAKSFMERALAELQAFSNSTGLRVRILIDEPVDDGQSIEAVLMSLYADCDEIEFYQTGEMCLESFDTLLEAADRVNKLAIKHIERRK